MSKGRKKGSGALGRSLIKDRNRTNRSKSSGDGWVKQLFMSSSV